MQGLIFVTWEKYLAERFGSVFLKVYRMHINETVANAPLAVRVYDDEMLLAGVEAASKLAKKSPDTLLREYGRYFIVNGLTSHLCAYILARIQSGPELLLAMRSAHAQMRRTPEHLIPPIFAFEVRSAASDEMVLIYDSPRHFCALLWGAIEGAAERYGERVEIAEQCCMKRGAAACRFELRFSRATARSRETPEQSARRRRQRHLANSVLAALPEVEGLTLLELQDQLRRLRLNTQLVRPTLLLEALHHLQYAGLVSSTANQPGDDLVKRRYWRVVTLGA